MSVLRRRLSILWRTQTHKALHDAQSSRPTRMNIQHTGPQSAGRYHAYLVRLWQDGPQAPWRASAQNAHTGEKWFFADLEALFAFLHKQTATGRCGDSG